MAYKYNKTVDGLTNLKRLWQQSTGLNVEPTTLEVLDNGDKCEVAVTLPKVEGALHFYIDRIPLDGIIKEPIELRSFDVRLDDGMLNLDDVFNAIKDKHDVVFSDDDDVRILNTENGYELVACAHSPFFKGCVPLNYIPALIDRITSVKLFDWSEGSVTPVKPESLLLNTAVALDAATVETPEAADWTVEGTVTHVEYGKKNKEYYFNTPNGTMQARTRVSKNAFIEFDVRVPASAKNALDLTRGVYAKLSYDVSALFQVNGDGLYVKGSEIPAYSHDFTKRTAVGFGYDRTLDLLLLYIDGNCVATLPKVKDGSPIGTCIVGSFTEREQHFYVYGIKTGSKLPTGFPFLVESRPYSMLMPLIGTSKAQQWSGIITEHLDYYVLDNKVSREIVDGVAYGDFYFDIECDVQSGSMCAVVVTPWLDTFHLAINPFEITMNGDVYTHVFDGKTRIRGRFSKSLNKMEVWANDTRLSTELVPEPSNPIQSHTERNTITLEPLCGTQLIYGVQVGTLTKGL